MELFEHSPEIRRLRWLGRVALVWALLLVVRLIHLQIFKHEELLREADSQQHRQLEIQAPRGMILDRTGERLAASVPVDSLAINPRFLKDPAVATELLARTLVISQQDLDGRIAAAQQSNRAFLWVKRRLEPDDSERLRAYNAEWMDFRQESKRVYLNGTAGANLIGSVDHQENGNAGVELSLQSDLQGRAGYVRVLTDVRHRGIESLVEQPPQPGKTVALTIDQRLQFVCDRRLRQAVEENGARTGTIVVMDPGNGDVLAISSYPTFDPNQPVAAGEDLSPRSNRAIAEPFEPGSVMKVFTIAAALETAGLRPETRVSCGNGLLPWYGKVIRDTQSYAALSVEEILWHSSNIGAINIGRRVGPENLYRYLREKFGFGQLTGITLPGESPGMLRRLERWDPGSIAYVSMGHEIGATTLQLARACSVIANGGLLVRPRIVLWKQRPEGRRELEPQPPPVRVLHPETAITVRKMMEGTILKGTGKKARLAAYTAGGKTGTAQIFDFQTQRYTKQYNSSFVGLAPLGDPRVVVVVTLNGVTKFGGAVAAPVFQEVASAALRYLGVTSDLPEAPSAGKQPAAEEPPQIAAAVPPEADPLPGPDSPADGVLIGPRMPDFYGKTLRAVMRESQLLGLELEIVGTGLAREQDPPPGSTLATRQRVRIQFAR